MSRCNFLLCRSIGTRKNNFARYSSSWQTSEAHGHFHRDLPVGVKPTHIIVGAGSAGCVLANRLTENPNNRVLLLEAGPKDGWHKWKIHMPAALMYNLCNDTYNWFYHTVAQRNMNDRVIYCPRGRVWGGSSSLNAMVYVRGHPYDYDRWEQEGAHGWSFKNCLPYFKKAQTHGLSSGPEDPYRGCNGPLHVMQGKGENPLHKAFLKAGEEIGVGYTEDMNGFRQEGFGPMDMTIKNGARSSSSTAYLKNILDRPNLYTSEGITCTKVLFHKNRAIGVEYIPKPEKIFCEDSVILCGGAINSPQLLMVSGIGPAKHLESHQIEVIQDMPGVGSNLQDHLEIYVQQKCTKPVTLYNQSSWRFPHNMIRTGVQWFISQSGLAASSHLETGGFIRSNDTVKHPDIQYHFLPSSVHHDGRVAATCHAFQVHAGQCVLSLWVLSDYKIKILVRLHRVPKGNKSCTRSVRQKAFDEFRGEELAPGKDCTSDDQLDEFVRAKSASAYHPSCTCKMGPASDPMSVIDPKTMNVYGFEGLKVVDASVMPSIISGNLNAPTIMLAEKAADIIAGNESLAPESPPIWTPKFQK
uniref:Glucose-methanol-choline oxidoreductase N-terminal domain-containing protein n=1 Tax=Ditylenchus dipsaci TaxID=166011 RepID=A0A915CYD0_9BILA